VGLLRVALTGGIASGKSTCLARFHELGAPVIDADRLAHEVIAPGTPGFTEVIARFGAGVLTPAGAIDRSALGRIVFADAEARRDLEAVVHPAAYEAIRRWFADLDARPGAARAAIADIPLLYETGRETEFDRVIVAACRPDQQLARLIDRSGLPPDEAALRLAAQMPLEEKARRAELVIDTSGTRADTARQVDEIWKQLQR
jgi:dephospho-CoA kinase